MPTSMHGSTASDHASDSRLAQNAQEGRAAQGAQLVPIRGQRRPWLFGLGALLSAVGVLIVVWLVGVAGQRQEVLVVSRAVEYGRAIAAEDLTVARVSVDPGVRVLSASARAGLVGQLAATELIPGMLMTQGMAEPVGEPRPGRVLVPVAVAAERMPAGGLRAGDRILAVDAGDASSRRTYSAAVVRIGPTDVNGVTVVDVTVAAGDGPSLAVAAANDKVAIVVQPGRY